MSKIVYYLTRISVQDNEEQVEFALRQEQVFADYLHLTRQQMELVLRQWKSAETDGPRGFALSENGGMWVLAEVSEGEVYFSEIPEASGTMPWAHPDDTVGVLPVLYSTEDTVLSVRFTTTPFTRVRVELEGYDDLDEMAVRLGDIGAEIKLGALKGDGWYLIAEHVPALPF